MVQKYRRIWSLLMAMVLLGSCVLSPLSIRANATTQDDSVLLAQAGDIYEEAGEVLTEEIEEGSTEETVDSVEETEEDSTEETGDSIEETEEDSTEEAGDSIEETEEDSTEGTVDSIEETEEDSTGETGDSIEEIEEIIGDFIEEIEEIVEEEPVYLDYLEPDYTGYSLIPGMQEHMASKPGTDYKAVTLSVTYLSYLDLELFEGVEVDHINVYANRISAVDANQYMTVSVVDVATRAKTEYRFYAKESVLTDFTSGQLVSLYPEEGVTVKVEKGQTLGFGKNGDSLVCNFQNDNNVPAALKGFYLNGGFSSGTAGGCICVDVYAREASGTSERDAVLTKALIGKKLSILGDSISTFQGYSNSTAVNNTLGSNEVFYTAGKAPWSVLQTWWQQMADRYGMEILVNNSWSGSTVASYSGKPVAGYGWNTRPDNLHDNTGTIVDPDIIVIYMGANDLSFNILCDPNALTEELYTRIEAEDYAPAEVTSLHEAAALMVHKVRKNYPNAMVYLFNSPVMKNGNTYRDSYNQVLDALAQRYGCTLVDLHGSALSTYSAYTLDGVHPNSAGMDVMTEVFAETLYQRYLSHTEHTWVTVPGVPATFRNPGLTDGIKCSECGEVQVAQEEIPALDYEPRMFSWTLNKEGNVLVSNEADLLTDNPLTLKAGEISGGTFSGVQLALADPLELRHDYPWSIEWCSSGKWAENSMLFSDEQASNVSGMRYLYRPSAFMALGTYTGSSYLNYIASLSGYNNTAEHTYRLVNQIYDDGSNMVCLYIDGELIGPLNNHYIGGSSQNATSDWVSGQDFRFRYVGAARYLVSGSGLKYLLVNEGKFHDTHTEQILPGVPPTEWEAGLTEGKRCSDCGIVLTVQQVIPALRETKLEAALAGKKLSVLGDGISTYIGVSNSTAVNNTLGSNVVWYNSANRLPSVNDTWWQQAVNRYAMECLVNNSWAGASVTSVCSTQGENSYGWNVRPGQLHDNTGTIVNPDLVAVYMGANDLAANVSCGTAMLDEAFYTKIEAADFIPSTDTNFEESAAMMIYKIITSYPDAEVFLFNIPAMSTGTDTNRDAYNDVLQQLAEHYGCTLVDLYSSAMSDYDSYTQDGTHPNAAGMDIMTEAFADALYERFIASPDAPSAATERGVYLSDLNYIASGTSIGHGSYKKDLSPGGGQIQLRVDGSVVSFDKGIGAHAASTVTFNIARYNQEYPRFCAKLGVDASQKSAGNVIFRIYGSDSLTAIGDYMGWTELLTTEALTAASAAVPVDLNVSDYNYIRLYADSNGPNSNDHSVYADARLVSADYNAESEYFPRLHSLEWYNEQLSRNDYSYNLENNQKLILEREFVSRIGLAVIQSCVKNSPGMKDTLNWLLDDSDALQLFIETGGNIRNAANTLNNLDALYTSYGSILGDSGDEYVYKKMLIALAVNWSNDALRSPYAFNGSGWNVSILDRFRAAKWVYDEGDTIYGKGMYTSYNMELMRILVGDCISYDEVRWVQHYGEKKYPNAINRRTGPYAFMGYVHPPFYGHAEYFTEDTWSAYDSKYDLTPYNILRSSVDNKVYRLWMVYESGGICWNISRVGQTLSRSYGIPSVGTFQPGHEAYFTYSENADGQGIWSIGNNVGGWVRAYSNWGGVTYRLPLGWGSDTAYSRTTNNSSSYILLAQGAMNQYTALQESMYLNMLADAYEEAEDKMNIYQASLRALDLNLDTYLDLIALYKSRGEEVTAEQWGDLAMQIIRAYTYYPVPMVDLLNAIEPYLGSFGLTVTNAKVAALNKAKAATAAESLQDGACRTLAASMLGQSTKDVLATFSFDGENGGAIVLGTSYAEFAFQLKYSLDGGETWLEYTKDVTDGLSIPLTDDQIASINAEDDILMYISGMDVNDENPDYFRIDIEEGSAPVIGRADAAAQISIHDGENWIIGKTKGLEYSTDNGVTWSAYNHEETRFEGDQTVLVRYRAHGTTLACAETKELNFTAANERDQFRHISVSNVTLVLDNGTTYYQGRKGDLALDANPFTGWHSENNQLDENKQIVVSFDKPRMLSGITYKSAGQNGRFLGVEIYVSMDDTSWTLVGTSSGWANDDTMKTVVLEKPVAAEYVKLKAVTNNGYICANDIDFFEDTTQEVHAASIHYSTTAPTNKNVTASLILDKTFTAVSEIEYVFETNSEHTFVYKDADGMEHQLKAMVTWIDREAPTAAVEYRYGENVSAPVTVTLILSEEVSMTRVPPEAVRVIDEESSDISYLFHENGTFMFEFTDMAGNSGSVTAKIDSIRPVDKAATFSFDGNNARKIVLDPYYTGRAVTVTYSLDGGKVWQEPVFLAADAEKCILLTAEQLSSISNISDSDGEIVVKAASTGIPEETAVIDLHIGPAAPALGNSSSSSQIAMHDGENWILGKIAGLEWSTDGVHWTNYAAGYRFEGDQEVQLRYVGKGQTLPGDIRTLIYTENEADFTYIPITGITLVSASGGQYYNNQKGEYALDANPFTTWHSAGNSPREFVVKFDQVRRFAGITYQYQGTNGRIRDVDVYVSLDGIHWIHAGSASAWDNNASQKELKLTESVSAQYVKLTAVQTYGNSSGEYNRFMTASTLDFYEDTTQKANGDTQIHYADTQPTKEDVLASLLLGEGCTAEEMQYTFTANGQHIFHYTDADGNQQSITAEVSWIDKTAPTAAVTYDPTAVTEGPVVATIVPSEKVFVINTINAAQSYTFTENGSFTFEMIDIVGNVGSVTAAVDWIIPDENDMVSFSFSGEDAGMLVLSPFFADREVIVEYQVCGGETKRVELTADADKRVALTEEELKALYNDPDQSSELCVTIHAASTGGYSKTQNINIINAAAPVLMNSGRPDGAAQIAAQDEENHITGKTAGLEYSLDGQNWTDYDPVRTRFAGDQSVLVRYGAYDLTRPSGSITLTFTEGSSPAFTYISAGRVSLVSAGNGQYYQNNKGEYALDGDPFTFWHSSSGAPKEFIVKFDRAVHFAGFRYTLLDSSRNGRFLDVEVYTSLDGQTWEKAGGAAGWTWNAYPAANAPRNLVLEQSVRAQYVKLVPTNTTGAFASARDIGFYEDTTAYVAEDVSVAEYIRLDGKAVWLVEHSIELDTGKVVTYEGNPMFYSEKYGTYCCLVIAETLEKEEAAAKIEIADGTADTVKRETMDMNGTGLVDASDAQFIYNIYSAYYDDFTADVTMEKFLQADINGDGKVDMEDATAVIASILQSE